MGSAGLIVGHRDVTLQVRTPPDRLYALLVDADRLGDWMIGLKSVETTGPLDRPGSTATLRFGGPFRVTSTVIDTRPGVSHQQRAREMLGLVTCTTTTRLEPDGAGTRLDVAFDYVVAGGPVGRLFEGMVGDEMAGRAGKEYARLKSLAEAGPGPITGQ